MVENIPEYYIEKKVLTFTFEDDGKTGTFPGKILVNSTFGSYILEPNNKITVKGFGGTKIGEGSGWGSKFWHEIYLSSSYELRNDTLRIFYDQDTKCMTFINHH